MTSIEKTFCETNFASCETKFEWITQTLSHWQASDSVALEEDRGGRRVRMAGLTSSLWCLASFFFLLHRGRQFVFGENLLSDASFCFSVSQVDASILGPWKCGRGRSSVSVCMCVLEREREKEEDRRRAAGSISTGIQSAVFLIQAVCWAFAPHLPFKRHPIPS